MRIAQDIPDGIYDNKDSLRRERWTGGKLVGFIDARIVVEVVKMGEPLEAWGHYPDPLRIPITPDQRQALRKWSEAIEKLDDATKAKEGEAWIAAAMEILTGKKGHTTVEINCTTPGCKHVFKNIPVNDAFSRCPVCGDIVGIPVKKDEHDDKCVKELARLQLIEQATLKMRGSKGITIETVCSTPGCKHVFKPIEVMRNPVRVVKGMGVVYGNLLSRKCPNCGEMVGVPISKPKEVNHGQG